jgi:hypothetical protein
LTNKKNNNDDKKPHVALVPSDLKFSYMFAMALKIKGHDNISIYKQQSNWVEQVFTNTLLKLVVIDVENMDIDQCRRLDKDIILNKKKNAGNSRSTQIRLCFLARDKSSVQKTRIQCKMKKEFTDHYGAVPYSVDDVVERPFTITEVIDTVNSLLLHLFR